MGRPLPLACHYSYRLSRSCAVGAGDGWRDSGLPDAMAMPREAFRDGPASTAMGRFGALPAPEPEKPHAFNAVI